MGLSQINIDRVAVRLAETPEDIDAIQHLRYRVFYEEYGAKPSPDMEEHRREFEPYDEIVDHLIVTDESIADPAEKIVGAYRLLRREVAEAHDGFYTAGEYDIAPLLNCGETLLELGRSCVLDAYRTRPVLQLLWQGITDYMLDHKIGLMFGCAIFNTTDIDSISEQLAYLYHYHLAPEEIRPRTLDQYYEEMNRHPKEDLNARRLFASLPPLIKGYLRLGGFVGDGAFIDWQFNSIDVCIVLPMAALTERYKQFYGRKIDRDIPDYAAREEEVSV